MEGSSAQDVKKLLVRHGLLVYRTRDDTVYLAERVRENLIMDAHITIRVSAAMRVQFLVRAQRTDFPSSAETEVTLLERARSVASDAKEQGFREVHTEVTPQTDPMDSGAVLDTWYQVAFEAEVSCEEELLDKVRYAMSLEKVAPR